MDRVPANAAARAQTLVLISLFGDVASSDALMALASDLSQAPLASLPARMNADLTTVLHQDLSALTDNVALADESEVASIADRWARQGTQQPPAVSLAADRQQVAPGEHASLSWASSGAEQCVSSWSGPVASEGVADSGALDSSHQFTLTCMGLGGVGSDSATVRVGSTPLPQPAPEPTPLPSLTLAAASPHRRRRIGHAAALEFGGRRLLCRRWRLVWRSGRQRQRNGGAVERRDSLRADLQR